MSGLDWSLVAEIFADALEQPTEARSAFVAARCADRPEVLAAVQRLLAAEPAVESAFLESLDPAAMVAAIRAVTASPDRVGAYRLVREIGRGGMGEVYLAERADGEFEQRVAIKLLKRGMDTDAILGRFVRERQILAGMNHPNIARLLDGGMTEDGRPYLVMEYVDGEPITRYADERRLSIDARLQLFCGVCLAVEYAHRNLVVHRDLKPSNILITADGQPKLLDFGIARVLSPERSADATTLTHVGARMLTPDYAAPEQFQDVPITTSTDVYGLGAVLYELLAGRKAFAARPPQMLPEDSLEREAPPLTRGLSDGTEGLGAGDRAALLDATATARSSDPARLRRQLAGDLETIVATALRVSPERRYPSVTSLRDDIRRYQQQLPVKARPDTVAYRVSRFVRRHRIGVLSAATVTAVVLGFGGTAVVQAAQIRKQAEDLEVERDRARREAAAAEQVSDFLVGVFEVSDPMREGRGDSIRARELLDRGAERIDADLDRQPELQARMLGVIGRAYDNLSRSDRAEPLLERAVELHRAAAGDTSRAVVAALHQLASVQQRRENAEAAATLREAIVRQLRIGPDDAAMTSLLVDLALAYHRQGDAERFGSTVADALDRLSRLPPEQSAASHDSLHELIVLLHYAGDWDHLDVAHRRLIEIERVADGPRSPAVAIAYASWAGAKQRSGHTSLADAREPSGDTLAADSLLSLARAIVRDIDEQSPETADAMAQVAAALRNRGALEQADTLYRAAIAMYGDLLGNDHRTVALLRMNLAATLQRRGMPMDAIPLLEGTIATLRQDAESAEILAVSEWRLATALRETGRIPESLAQFQTALQQFEQRFPPDYILSGNLRREYGSTLIDAGRFDRAEPMLRRAIQILGGRWGEADPRVDEARIELGRALTGLGRHAEAETMLAAALERLEQNPGPDDPLTKRARQAHQALQRSRSRSGG